jgi:4-alpha-glucanotransferase
MFLSRASGILLHPTSLPGKFGIGDLGKEAYRFVDFLSESFQQMWQVLPLGPTGYGNSPYLSYSALAGNPLLISLEQLQEDELLAQEDLRNLPEFPPEQVDFDLAIQIKMPLLKKASDRFKTNASASQKQKFQQFSDRHTYWLDDYALFMAIKENQNGASWNQWDKAIAKREPQAVKEWGDRLREEIFYHKFLQFEFFRQWTELKKYANDLNISLFGDIPIYVAHDSADVWAHPDIFCLDEETGEPALMAGVPPDYFSATGQLWGNPVYNWDRLKETNFKWWVQRVEGMLEYFDLMRIDHFRGFQAYWAVPEGEKTAVKGEWIEAPGEAFFQILGEELGKLPIVAEDLGLITPEVEALRDKFEFPGMKVLQFAFDSDRANPFLPYNYASRNYIVYTGTHDNNTTLGWFNERSPEEQDRVVEYLGCICPEGIHWSLIRLALGSIANQTIFPLQDILGLGSEGKMNVPGREEGNWSWRYRPEALTKELSDRLKRLTYLYGRAPNR